MRRRRRAAAARGGSTAHHFLRPFMEKKLGITDTVGAVSLHALPALVAWLAGIIVVRAEPRRIVLRRNVCRAETC